MRLQLITRGYDIKLVIKLNKTNREIAVDIIFKINKGSLMNTLLEEYVYNNVSEDRYSNIVHLIKGSFENKIKIIKYNF